MKLKIEKWGPIGKAEIDLSKQLIIFTGPNGTGKTYISYLLYGLLTAIGAKSLSIIKGKKDNRYYELFHGDDLEKGLAVQFDADPSQIFDLFKDMFSKKWGGLIDFIDVDEISNNLNISIVSSLDEWATWLYKSEISYMGDLSVEKKPLSYTFNISPRTDAKINIPFQIAFLCHKLLFEGVYLPYMLTAERSGIYTFSKEISLGRLRDSQVSFRPRYPRPIADSLAHAENLANDKKYLSKYSKLADEIESDILQGKMLISDDGDIQYQHENGVFSYHLASTMVKTLSPIIFYLRYKADDNLWLIIDEPEINLHPNNQVLLARVFARMINSGLHLLIATHSDYIIREINNMVMMSRKNTKVVKKLLKSKIYQKNEYINPESMAVYYFSYPTSRSKTVKVENLAVMDNGFSVSSIDSTIEKQNRIVENLYYGIKYGEE